VEEPIRVETDQYASDEEVRAVQQAFRDFGMEVVVERPEPGPPPANGGWIIHVFISGFFGAAAGAAWNQLVALIQRLAKARGSAHYPIGMIIVSDEHAGRELFVEIMQDPYPPAAWEQLEELRKTDNLRGRRIYWDADQRRWQLTEWGVVTPSNRAPLAPEPSEPPELRARPSERPSLGERLRRLFRR
jgi:hypothetical protein